MATQVVRQAAALTASVSPRHAGGARTAFRPSAHYVLWLTAPWRTFQRDRDPALSVNKLSAKARARGCGGVPSRLLHPKGIAALGIAPREALPEPAHAGPHCRG